VSAPKPAADAALDALAEALVPRVLRLLKERASADEDLAELLAGSGFELADDSAEPAPVERVKRARKGRAA